MQTSRSRTLKTSVRERKTIVLVLGDRPLGDRGSRARTTPDGLYLKQFYLEHLAEAARAERDAVALDGGQVRLAWHSRLPSR